VSTGRAFIGISGWRYRGWRGDFYPKGLPQRRELEYAAERFGTRLVVVLGHSQCGAILATLDELQRPAERQSPNLRSIVDRVRPSVAALLDTPLKNDLDALVGHAVRANIRASVDHLRHGSPLLEQLIARDGLLVVGAEYSLETGRVEFFDGVSG